MRLVYVESGTDEDSLERLTELGRRIIAGFQTLPAILSTPAEKPNRDLEAELEAVAFEDDFYHVEGNTVTGAVVISKFPDRVDFYDQLNNRVVNIVPVENLLDIVQWCDDTTQTVGVYPETLRDTLRDPLSLAGVQRLVSLSGHDPMHVYRGIHAMPPGMPHDGIEPLRRSVRWVIDHRPENSGVELSIAAE